MLSSRRPETRESPIVLRLLALFLPGLIPSWKFFKSIEPSPRVEWRLLTKDGKVQRDWQEFHPRPQKVSAVEMLKRLFWNPRWNDNLYLVSLSERLTIEPTEHSRREIIRLLRQAARETTSPASHLQFRLVFVQRRGAELQKVVTHLSEPEDILEASA